MFRTRVPALALAMVLVTAGCAGSGAATTTIATGTAAAVETASFPYTVDSGGVRTTVGSPPAAIVSLSPTSTEMLFAIGAGPQVVAVDEYSYHPPEAPVTDLSGFTPNLEAIAGYEPDLVVVSDDIDGIASALDEVGIPVLVLPTATVVDDAYRQIRILGAATGQVATAERLAADMQAEIDALVTGAAGSADGLTYYHELGSDGGGSFYSVTSATFVGEVFGAFGLENVADPADVDGFGYPILSVEFIIDADPDLIFYTSCCGDTPDSISARPGWDSIAAVRSGAVFQLDDDLASRWGPRLVEFFRIVADALRG
jgi:iron complex transport system substrate-binding protein